MAQGDSHPITTPKGAAVLTVILSVIGVFAPFLASLETAQLFAGVAVLVIVWLYAEDGWDAIRTRAGYRRLVPPIVSISTIVGVAAAATWIVSNRPVAPPPPPAITPRDVSNAVSDALTQNNRPQPQAPLTLPNRSPEYKIVIQDAPLPEPPRAQASVNPPAKPAISISDLAADLKRDQVGFRAKLDCSSSKYGIQVKIMGLRNQAAEMQNAFYYGKNDRLMIDNLKKWTSEVEKMFEENKGDLPSVEVFHMATEGQNYTSFLGINQTGTRAWYEMNAKSQVLESIANDLGRYSCDLEHDAAIARCIQAKTC